MTVVQMNPFLRIMQKYIDMIRIVADVKLFASMF